ncbi:S24 family peptidase [Halodesulfovibrio aestuarii]|uniref:LexA family transcriptional regulator n=1 Tax=Halodesulfovibrio aestuarii TaxID=126333 RepID=UPI0004885D12
MNKDYSEEEWQLQEFIAESIKLVGGVPKLAEIAGVSPRTVYAWKKGERYPNRQNLKKLTRYLEKVAEQTESSTELYFPLSVGAERRGASEHVGRSDVAQVDDAATTFLAPPRGPDDFQDEFLFVDKAEARPSAGGGSLATSDYSDGRYAFRLDWILHKTQDVNSLKIMEVMGRSMESTLHNGDLCLVNQSDKDLVEDRVYVVRLDDEIYVKRFSRIPGKYLFRGDNRELAYQDIEIDPRDESRSWEVIGRVIWAGKDL